MKNDRCRVVTAMNEGDMTEDEQNKKYKAFLEDRREQRNPTYADQMREILCPACDLWVGLCACTDEQVDAAKVRIETEAE